MRHVRPRLCVKAAFFVEPEQESCQPGLAAHSEILFLQVVVVLTPPEYQPNYTQGRCVRCFTCIIVSLIVVPCALLAATADLLPFNNLRPAAFLAYPPVQNQTGRI